MVVSESGDAPVLVAASTVYYGPSTSAFGHVPSHDVTADVPQLHDQQQQLQQLAREDQTRKRPAATAAVSSCSAKRAGGGTAAATAASHVDAVSALALVHGCTYTYSLAAPLYCFRIDHECICLGGAGGWFTLLHDRVHL